MEVLLLLLMRMKQCRSAVEITVNSLTSLTVRAGLTANQMNQIEFLRAVTGARMPLLHSFFVA
jgi:hypothetical protein